MSTYTDTLSQQKTKGSCAANFLSSSQRKSIGLQAIRGTKPISHVANQFGVSRKFIYQQKNRAIEGISKAFVKQTQDNNVLFHIPVTKKWLSQAVLGLIFISRASYQGVSEFFRDIFDCHISKGTVHNILYKHLATAKNINEQQDLINVQEGLHDEIYQCGKPVLVGCCARSTYCYLLNLVETCDSNAWGVNLLDLTNKQNLNPQYTVIDGGKSARSGQKEAWPETPAHGDIFHALKPFLELVTYLENKALNTLKIVDGLKHKILSRRGKWKDAAKRASLYEKLIKAEEASNKALNLANDIKQLYDWLKNDVLALVGPLYHVRRELLDFIADELRARESLSHKIVPMRTYLDNHKNNLLEFAKVMERHFTTVAQESRIGLSTVLSVFELKRMSPASGKYWEKYAKLKSKLKGKFDLINSLVDRVLKITVRANSLVENLNSRLRTYFTLRRDLGNEYLSFLQFFLNHRRFMRSEYTERVGKSPAELMTGKQHPHWLEMLGFQMFKRSPSGVDVTETVDQNIKQYTSIDLSESSFSFARMKKAA